MRRSRRIERRRARIAEKEDRRMERRRARIIT